MGQRVTDGMPFLPSWWWVITTSVFASKRKVSQKVYLSQERGNIVPFTVFWFQCRLAFSSYDTIRYCTLMKNGLEAHFLPQHFWIFGSEKPNNRRSPKTQSPNPTKPNPH